MIEEITKINHIGNFLVCMIKFDGPNATGYLPITILLEFFIKLSNSLFDQ